MDDQELRQHDSQRMAEMVHGTGHQPVDKKAVAVALGGSLLLVVFALLASLLSPGPEAAITHHPVGIILVAMFLVGYGLVMLETRIHVLKCLPTLLTGGLMWLVIAVVNRGDEKVEHAFRHTLTEYAELLLFLLVAVTYVVVVRERGVFDALRAWLVKRGFSYKALFWITGWLAFWISPVADNMTTALILCSVVMAAAGGKSEFIVLCCINIVNAANAGGAFSPFGDITTLMAWQAKKVEFLQFFWLLPASLVMFLLPAALMSRFVPEGKPAAAESDEPAVLKRGARRVVALFGATICTAVLFHLLLHMPPMAGMMLGLGFLGIFAYYLQVSSKPDEDVDLFDMLVQAAFEADTFLFFYGVIMMVGALGFVGYLAMLSNGLYGSLGFSWANIAMGAISAIVDNIPIMFSVLGMNPAGMGLDEWLLVTLTCGVGGSMLSIGSAAGVALMGFAVRKDDKGEVQEKYYTFGSHLRWAPVLAIAYAVSIAVHLFAVVPVMRAIGVLPSG
ncbi:MAG: sodium:proton antiporter NhaD [Planctomycetota bacterium]